MRVKLFPKNNRLNENGFRVEDEEALYEAQLQDIIDRPRWYLDNLDNMREYRVSWVNYKETTVTLPHKYCIKRQIPQSL